MKKIVTIVGARPQFIKAAVMSRTIALKAEFEEVIIHTGQHYDSNMSALFFDELAIPKPKYHLDINDLSHGAMTGHMLMALEEILKLEKPDAVLVYGDTNSTLAGALAAKKLHIKLIHVEAGLRSFNMKMPEEINRIVTDRIADLLLCPTPEAVKNLEKEGLDAGDAKIVLSGDIMKESVTMFSALASQRSNLLTTLKLSGEGFILATLHRQENTDDENRLKSIMQALEKLSKTSRVVMPLHPRTRKRLEALDLKVAITFIEPVGYLDMLALLKNCKMVITDSGGLQKEAFFCKKHCIIVRDETEWVELVSHGIARIAGADGNEILRAYKMFEQSHSDFSLNLYGNDVGETMYKEIRSLIK